MLLEITSPQAGTFKNCKYIILLTHGLIKVHIITLQGLFSWLSLHRKTVFISIVCSQKEKLVKSFITIDLKK